jgi:hypothetical protein
MTPSGLGIVRGNPGVFQLYPYHYPPKPLPLLWVRVLGGKGRGFLKMYLLKPVDMFGVPLNFERDIVPWFVMPHVF